MSDELHLRPKRTHHSNKVWRLEGGNEDNDLWAFHDRAEDGTLLVRSTWVPTDEQRARIAAGENIELIVWGPQPPVAMMLDATPLGKAP